MTTKMSVFDIRRRHHGEVIEGLVLQELTGASIIQKIDKWDGLIRPKYGQPYFTSSNGSSECHLDEFGWVRNDERTEMRSCIIEVKCMRIIDWNDWQDHDLLHMDKCNQRLRHLKIANEYKFDGVAFIAVNKDSSEISIRVFDGDDKQLFQYIT